MEHTTINLHNCTAYVGSVTVCMHNDMRPADGVFDYYILLACAICPSFFAEVAK